MPSIKLLMHGHTLLIRKNAIYAFMKNLLFATTALAAVHYFWYSCLVVVSLFAFEQIFVFIPIRRKN